MKHLALFSLLWLLVGVLLFPAHAEEQRKVLLKPEDIIRMEVFGQEDLQTQARVMKTGQVVFPLIGAVQIGGLTVSEAIEEVRSLYAEKYLVDPKVSISVEQSAGEFVSVIGAVKAAGSITIPDDGKMDLSTALAGAGGLSETADRGKIVLTRSNGKVETHDAGSLENGKRVPMSPGDRVIVHQSKFFNKTVTILGRVRKPGPVEMPISGRLDVVNAIAMAGGFDELANPKKVSINRGGRVTILNLREMTEKGDRRYFLLPDDIVTVAERWF
jgi:polysaccharide export outer membrane protein